MSRCLECGTEIDTAEKRGSRRYCSECAHDRNIDKTLKRYHFKKNNFQTHTGPMEGHYWKLVWAPPGQEDLLGLHFTNVDFKYGSYEYLKGAVMERAGKIYTFDGRRAR
jgi:hypothetical protein